MSQFWESCGNQVLAPAQKLKSESADPLAIHQIVTWKKMAKSRRPSQAVRAYERQISSPGTLPPSEEDDLLYPPVMVNPVTMEEMLMLPRCVSRDSIEEVSVSADLSDEDCSPNKAYMLRNGGFPGSGHIAGENALLLMSSIY
jgi:hypothetical protein